MPNNVPHVVVRELREAATIEAVLKLWLHRERCISIIPPAVWRTTQVNTCWQSLDRQEHEAADKALRAGASDEDDSDEENLPAGMSKKKLKQESRMAIAALKQVQLWVQFCGWRSSLSVATHAAWAAVNSKP